jgi:DNA-directed RNA polymerase subunit E'/Rpb7
VAMFSPLKLEIVMVEKIKRYQSQKDGQLKQIAQVYGKFINEKPDFDYYVVVFAPATVPIMVGSVIPVPMSGMRIYLGDDVGQDLSLGLGLPLTDAKKPKIP